MSNSEDHTSDLINCAGILSILELPPSLENDVGTKTAREWIDEGVRKDAMYLILATDDDRKHYPVYASSEEERKKAEEGCGRFGTYRILL